MSQADQLLPLFLKIAGRRVLLVGGGPVATAKAATLADAGAQVAVVSPDVTTELAALVAARTASGWSLARRPFEASDANEAWLIVAAAPAEVNRAVAAAAEERRIFSIAVDDPAAASAYGGGVIRRDGVTLAISTSGVAPALAGLLREGLDALLPDELDAWIEESRHARVAWRAEGVPMALRRPRLLAALNRLYERRTEETNGAASAAQRGRVTLVGAGPGDPDLLTLRGSRCLGEADLVLYDALSSEKMRAFAPGARWFYVGKRACRQSISQDVLNRIMVKEARRGLRVVRLKCGDPFVFGRGGEEALALAAEGIACEVVPGLSSAIAAPALAGIPVTHRGAASAFVVVSGHHETVYRPVFQSLPKVGVTVVVLMGLGQREKIAQTLAELGWPATTPAAVVLGAATPAAWRWTGTLATLGAVDLPPAAQGDHRQPGLLVIGDVVAVAAEIEDARARPGQTTDAAPVAATRDRTGPA